MKLQSFIENTRALASWRNVTSLRKNDSPDVLPGTWREIFTLSLEHPEKAFGEAALVRKFLPLGKLSNRPTDAPESSEALEPRGTSSEPIGVQTAAAAPPVATSKGPETARRGRGLLGKIDIPLRRFASTHESAFHLATESAPFVYAWFEPSPRYYSPPTCVPLRSSLVRPCPLLFFPFPSLRCSALFRSPPLATPDCSVSRFAIYSSWRKNESHAARIALPIFHPCRASRRRISRTRVIIEPRTTTRSEGRAFLLTKLANEI